MEENKENVKVEEKEEEKECYRPSMYEYNRSLVYATGNKWAIENWNATH